MSRRMPDVINAEHLHGRGGRRRRGGGLVCRRSSIAPLGLHEIAAQLHVISRMTTCIRYPPPSVESCRTADFGLEDEVTIIAEEVSIAVVRYAIATQGIPGAPKSEASSNRVVPLAGWLADELRDYLTNVHPFSATVEPSKTVRLITFRTRRCSPVAAIATRSIGRSRFTRAICTRITFSPSARRVA